MTKTFANRSVRDLRQAARVSGDYVLVTSSVGRSLVGNYLVLLSDWSAIDRGHPNPTWWKRDHVRRLTPDLDAQPGGPDQAERIRDAQVAAIDAAFAGACECIEAHGDSNECPVHPFISRVEP
jgi:hypothetical protein